MQTSSRHARGLADSRRPRAWDLVIAALAASALASCAHSRLVPAEGAKLVRDGEGATLQVDDGVRFVATLDDWRGLGDKLPDDVTPIKVRIVNHSGQSIAILYERIALIGRKGKAYRALPVVPLVDDGAKGGRQEIRPIFATAKFQVAPRYSDVYPSLAPGPNRLPRDEDYYRKAYSAWHGALPSREIRRMALPEGVLAPGGELTGYLYFENPIDTESKVTLSAELPSGRTDTVVGRIDIPLRVD